MVVVFAIIAVVVLTGIFNPWTGLFNSLYSPKPTKEEDTPVAHKSFRLTKEH